MGYLGRRITVGLLALAVVGCSSNTTGVECFQPGTYIEVNDAAGASSAEICFDTDCVTVGANEPTGQPFTGFRRGDWSEGRTMTLKLTVFDASHKAIDSVTESRTMNSKASSCGVLYYDWKNGHLHRVN